jgi:enoyl-CoA hydratase/carnithine racemase
MDGACGLGADTALACDFIVASDQANFAWSYILRGVIPDGGGMIFFTKKGLVYQKLKELIFSRKKSRASRSCYFRNCGQKCLYSARSSIKRCSTMGA